MHSGHVLVVDDHENNRDLLSRYLRRQSHSAVLAEDGCQALGLLRQQAFDLVLLDIMMPEMDGYQVLEEIKADPALRHIPVIMISALDDIDSVVKCIQLGAEDYLPKPFNPVLLKARVGACLEKKRLRDQEQTYLQQLEVEQQKVQRLLLNVLPEAIADRLKEEQSTIADSFMSVTVLFADIVDFTSLSAHISARALVDLLNQIFSVFDQLAEQHQLEKIKTIGDSYMVVGGLPIPRIDHAEAVAEMALDMQRAIGQFKRENGLPFQIRVGLHSGPVVAGVIGTKKFIYDLWGDTVNTASRMEASSLPGGIQVSPATYERLKDRYLFEARDRMSIKGKGTMSTYLLKGRR